MYAVLSDIHGNLHALKKVVEDMERYPVEGIILLGDLIDYGMQSNEVVAYIKTYLHDKVVCKIWGNHEKAILTGDYTRFLSKRGADAARRTEGQLNRSSREYLNREFVHEGIADFDLDGIRVLAVHGSLEDHYWKSIAPGKVEGRYGEFDLILSGHSHYSHFFTKFYDVDDPERRNKHVVRFINPGSVGQPRNHNPNAQYALFDTSTGAVLLQSVTYDIDAAMKLFDGSVDDFYRVRLKTGV